MLNVGCIRIKLLKGLLTRVSTIINKSNVLSHVWKAIEKKITDVIDVKYNIT